MLCACACVCRNWDHIITPLPLAPGAEAAAMASQETAAQDGAGQLTVEGAMVDDLAEQFPLTTAEFMKLWHHGHWSSQGSRL